MSITVHYLSNSRAQRILFMLEELGVPYELELYYRHKKTQLAPERLKEVHPLGKSPVITDGDLTLAESGAILEYLATKYGEQKLIPAGGNANPTYLQYKYWLHYAEGSLMPLLVTKMLLDRIYAKSPPDVKGIAKRLHAPVLKGYLMPSIQTHLDFVESHLAQNEWFAGEQFTAADVQMSFPLESVIFSASSPDKYPNIKAWVEKIHARPAYQRALAAGEPYIYA